MEKKILFSDIYRKISGYVEVYNDKGVLLLRETDETDIRFVWKFYNREVLQITPVNEFTTEICIGGYINED